MPATPVITSATTASGQVGVAFSYQITATNAPTGFAATGLPGGLSLNAANGAISGVPTAAGSFTVSLSAANAGGTGMASLSLTIVPATPVITSATTASGQVGVAFSYRITASHSPTSYGASNLPAGLQVDTATGVIAGTPTLAGSFTVGLSATNAGGTGSATLHIGVVPAAPIITSALTAATQVGQVFSYQITASNAPTTFAASPLPTGLNVDAASGLISGKPGVAGTFKVGLSATNSGGTGSATLTLTVVVAAPVITSPLVASAQVSKSFTYQIAASNAPTGFGASGLPVGLRVDATTGLITGTPTAVGNYAVKLSAANAGGTGSATLNLTVSPAPVKPPVVTSATTANGQVGKIFSYQITASNSPTSYAASNLPPGLSIDAGNGMISGTPTAVGAFTVGLSATNSGGTGSATLTVTIVPAAPVITSALLASGQVGQTFTYQITASNAPVSFGAKGLPAGVMIDPASGLISGTPTVAGTFAVALTATNAGGTGTATLRVSVVVAAPVITSVRAPSGQVGKAFDYQIVASNAPTSYGARGLPAGLSVDPSSGAISGVPTTAGSFTVNLSAANAGGTGTASLSLTIVPATPVITSATTASGQVGVAFSYQITATNAPTGFAATGLPGGLSLNAANGAIAGVPTAAGSFTVSLSAANAGGTGTAS